MALNFIKKVLLPLEFSSGKTRVALVTYNDQAVVRFGLNTYVSREEIVKVIKNRTFEKSFKDI